LKRLLSVLLLTAAFGAAEQTPFRLDSGEFQWIDFRVNQVPTEVDCRFRVVRGDPTVHMELLSVQEFDQLNRGDTHATLAVSNDGKAGRIRRLLDWRGRYIVAIVNKRGARPALVSFELRTDVNPNAQVSARELSPERRMAVIAISFGIFFAIVAFCGWKMMRAVSSGRSTP